MASIVGEFIEANDEMYRPVYTLIPESFPEDFTREMAVKYIKMRYGQYQFADSIVVGRRGE